MPALKETRAGQPGAHHSFRSISLSHVLVAGQIAISLVMLVAAGLFVRTLSNLHSIDLGFNRQNVLLFQLDARKAGHKDPEIIAFYADLRRRFSAIPGVRSTSLSEDSLVLAGSGLPINVLGAPPNDANRFLTVGPEFFSTMQIPILAGRDFAETDRPGSPSVAVINQVFARANFGNRNPLGQRLILREAGDEGRVARDLEIVGVSKNARYGRLTEAIPPVVYMPYNQGYPQRDHMVYALRTSGDPLRYVGSVREIVRRADARLPVSDVRTETADIDQTINQEITFAELCSGFAILALVIACVGLYGTVSYNVARRTGEIGIRMALGARAGDVLRLVMSESMRLVAIGVAIGLAVAMAAGRLVSSLLFGLGATDAITILVATVVMVTVSALAGYLPARRASRVDPLVALHYE
jgi:predicted permease